VIVQVVKAALTVFPRRKIFLREPDRGHKYVGIPYMVY